MAMVEQSMTSVPGASSGSTSLEHARTWAPRCSMVMTTSAPSTAAAIDPGAVTPPGDGEPHRVRVQVVTADPCPAATSRAVIGAPM